MKRRGFLAALAAIVAAPAAVMQAPRMRLTCGKWLVPAGTVIEGGEIPAFFTAKNVDPGPFTEEKMRQCADDIYMRHYAALEQDSVVIFGEPF